MMMLVGTAAFAGPTGAGTTVPVPDEKAGPEKLALAKEGPKTVKAVKDSKLPPTLEEKTANLDPELLKRFDAFRTFTYQKHGIVLEINSGYRSTEKQAYLYRTLPRGMASAPGTSLHEKGTAIDYRPASPTYNQDLAAFGLKAPYAGVEDWHVERSDN